MTGRFPSKTTKSKRRKLGESRQATREPSPEDVLYAIRDIIDEKRVKGKLLYKVDWADHPTTGKRYDPTWEPAENVTEAAVSDWEKQKRRRIQVQSSSGQSVLKPNWRAKRHRDRSVSEDNERPSKRSRGSVDSGYTSTGEDDDGDWSLVQSVPEKRGQIVLELPARLGFDPSEYRIIPCSQSAPSSQGVPPEVSHSQGLDSQRSQETVPESQGFDYSLHTQSTGQSAAIPTAATPAEADTVEELSKPAPSGSLLPANTEGQPSRSDSEIPSRQPETSFQVSKQSSGLLEIHDQLEDDLQNPLIPASAEPRHLLGQSSFPFNDSSWSGGFLTQVDHEFSAFSEAPGRSQFQEAHRDLDHDDQQDYQFAGSSRGDLSPHTESHLQLQAAQRVPLIDSNPGLVLTQISAAFGQGSEDVVPDTVQRAPGAKLPCRARDQSSNDSNDPVSSQGFLSQPPTPAKNNPAPSPFTPTRPRMDGPPTDDTPRSAVDIMLQLHADAFGTSPEVAEPQDAGLEPPLLSPSIALQGMGTTAPQALGNAAPPKDHHSLPAAEEVNPQVDMEFEQHPQTVAPSVLTTSVDHISGPEDGLPGVDQQIHHGDAGGVLPAPTHIDPNQLSNLVPEDQEDSEEDDGHGRDFLVTLPMAANSRARYLETISHNKAAMIAFGNIFNESYSRVPDPALVAKMDSFFERLLALCDLPAFDDSPLDLSKEEMKKHAINSNSKFLFLYEFLTGLWGINIRVLVLSQPGRVFEYIEAVVSAAGFPYTILGQEPPSGQSVEGLTVVLAVVGQDLSKFEGGVDVVIAFDHTARSVQLPASLGYGSMAPIVLSLVVTYSLEHIDQQLLQLDPDLDGLQRKNALNLAIATAKEHLRNPKRGFPEPHEAAEMFYNFLRSPEGGLAWEPHPLSPDIFDIYISTQDHTQESQRDMLRRDLSVGRKRPADNAEEGTPKRARFLLDQPERTATPARMSDLLNRTLATLPVGSGTATHVEVPVEQLERMAEKIAELEAHCATQKSIEAKLRDHVISLESQLRSHEKTIQSIQPKYMEALRDRGTYEKECSAALEKEKAATERLETQQAKIDSLTSKLADANEALASSSNPDLAKLARLEKERDEALANIEKLEKKVRVTQNDLDYSRKAYQDASNAHSELNQENQELRTKVADLEKRASDNLVRIHEIHAQTEYTAVDRQIHELRAILENRERELDRAMTELRLLKNGRRETRGSSVPRSPRTSVMSPRNRGVGGGSGSRGTSPAPFMSSDGLGSGGGGGGGGGGGYGGTPVPGMTYFGPAGNAGRWPHLRD